MRFLDLFECLHTNINHLTCFIVFVNIFMIILIIQYCHHFKMYCKEIVNLSHEFSAYVPNG